MINSKIYQYLIQFIIIGLSFNHLCCANEWIHLTTINSDSKLSKLIEIEELSIPSDFLIQLRQEDKTLSTQLYNHLLRSSEFIVIKPFHQPIKYDVYFKKTNELIEYKSLSFNERFIENKLDEIIYTYLYKNSQFQFKNNNKRKLLEHFIKFFNTHPKLEYSINEISNRYFWLLNYIEEYHPLIDKFNKIQNVDIKNSNLKRKLLWLKALTYLNTENHVLAEKYFNKLIFILNNDKQLNQYWISNKKEIVAVYGFTLTLKAYMNQHDTTEYVNLIKNQLKGVESNNRIILLYYLAAAYSITGNYKNSLMYLSEAETIIDHLNLNSDLHYIYNQMAVNYYFLNDYQMAQIYYRKVISLLDTDINQAKIAITYYNLANTYRILGDYSRAYRYFEKSFEINKSLNLRRKWIRDLNVMGSINRIRKQYNLAVNEHKQSIKFFVKDNKRLLLYSVNELSKDYYQQGDLELSEKTLKTSIIIHKETTQDLKYNQILQSSDLAFNTLFKKAIKDFVINDTNGFDSILLLAKIALNKKDNTFLEKYYLMINNYNQLTRLPIEVQLSYYEFKLDYYLFTKKFATIETTIDRAFALINETRSKFDVSDLALFWSHQAQTIIDKYIDLLVKQNKLDKIFEVLEKYYAVNLREKRLNSIDKNITILTENSRQARDTYIELERNSLLEKDKNLQNQADEAKEHYLTLLDSSDVNNDAISLNYLSIPQVQEKLSKDELFIRYYINDNNAFVFVIKKNNYDIITLPNKQKLNQSVKQILKSIKSKRFTNLSDTNQFLAKLLPIEKIYSGQYKKLIIVPDGVLNLLPFGVLNISQNDNDYKPLATIINVERTYSASDYFSHADIPQNSETISVLANPVFIENANKDIKSQYKPNNKLWEFKALPFSEQEARDINDIFSDQQVNLLMGENATNDNFLSEQTRNSNIIHIASHGFFNAANLEDVGLATSVVELDKGGNEIPSAGILAMREILYKPFKSNLVVISGCETTLGKEISGEGFNSLSRGLLSQGVGSVIGTIWSISDRATPTFMKEFYTNLREMHGNVSKALNTTKRNFATLPKFRRYRHPYYWAGFVLTSSNRKISENIFN